MEVGGDLVAVTVPLGVYATMAAYCSALQEAGRDQHPAELKHFGIKLDPTQPFVRPMINIQKALFQTDAAPEALGPRW